MKVKLFTHTDLDGCGCAIVANNAFSDVDVEYCNYDEINEKILDFLENDKPTNYDRIFITDISFNEEVAERLDLIHRGGVSGVQLVDHHPTALWLAEKYPMWCHVRVEESNLAPLQPEGVFNYSPRKHVASSGTTLFYKFLRNKHIPCIERNLTLKAFAEAVRRYDTWEWHNIYGNDHPKRLNDLLYLIGQEKFVERFSNNPLPTFTDTELTLLEVEEFRCKSYIEKKILEAEFTTVTVGGKEYRVAYVFAEQYGSLLGNVIAEKYPSMDFVALIDASCDKVSIRGIHDHLDLGNDVAMVLGQYHKTNGGGHKKACAFSFTREISSDVFLRAFGQEELDG